METVYTVVTSCSGFGCGHYHTTLLETMQCQYELFCGGLEEGLARIKWIDSSIHYKKSDGTTGHITREEKDLIFLLRLCGCVIDEEKRVARTNRVISYYNEFLKSGVPPFTEYGLWRIDEYLDGKEISTDELQEKFIEISNYKDFLFEYNHLFHENDLGRLNPDLMKSVLDRETKVLSFCEPHLIFLQF